MKTIDIILKESGYTKAFLLKQRQSGRTNWMWWKWGIQWTDEMRWLKLFRKQEEQELLNDLDLVSDIHDLDFENANSKNIFHSIIRFIKANYRLIMRIIRLLHWTTVTSRTWLFILSFIWLNTVWIKYFNWAWKTKK